MAKSKQDILEILKGLNSLPVEDVKEVLDSLDMKFSDWETLTNQRFDGYLQTRDFKDYQLSMIQDKTDISYEEFLEVSKLCNRYAETTGFTNKAKHERGKRDSFLQGVPEEEIAGRVLAEEEVQTLEQIEAQWNDVRAKYSPFKEVERVTRNARNILRFNVSSSQKIETLLEELKVSMEQLKKSFGCIDETKHKNDAITSVEGELLSAMQEGRIALETTQSLDLSEFYRFMEENGVSQADIEQHYKSRFTGMKPSSRPFIMAREGKGFRLNDSGELEVVDEQCAKDLIAEDFFPTSITAKSISKLEKGKEYGQLTGSLPSKNIDRLTQEDIQHLMLADEDGINMHWIVQNPSKIQKGLKTLQILGKDIDLVKVKDALLGELESLSRYLEDEEDAKYISSKIEQALSAIGYDVTTPKENYEKQGETVKADDLSSLSVEELIKMANNNNQTIANNEQEIKQALIQKILGQQQQIAEQTAEIDRLKSQKEL